MFRLESGSDGQGSPSSYHPLMKLFPLHSQPPPYPHPVPPLLCGLLSLNFLKVKPPRSCPPSSAFSTSAQGAQHTQAAPTFPPLQEAQSTRKRLCSPSPVTLFQQLREDFNLESEEESSSPSPKPPQPLSPPAAPVPCPSPENFREASPLTSPLSLSLDPTTPQRGALLSSPTLNLSPSSPPVLPLDPTSGAGRCPAEPSAAEGRTGRRTERSKEEKLVPKDWAG